MIRKFNQERENSKKDEIHGDQALISKLKRGLSDLSNKSDSSPNVLRKRLDSNASSVASQTNIAFCTEADDNDEDQREEEEKKIEQGLLIVDLFSLLM